MKPFGDSVMLDGAILASEDIHEAEMADVENIGDESSYYASKYHQSLRHATGQKDMIPFGDSLKKALEMENSASPYRQSHMGTNEISMIADMANHSVMLGAADKARSVPYLNNNFIQESMR